MRLGRIFPNSDEARRPAMNSLQANAVGWGTSQATTHRLSYVRIHGKPNLRRDTPASPRNVDDIVARFGIRFAYAHKIGTSTVRTALRPLLVKTIAHQ